MLTFKLIAALVGITALPALVLTGAGQNPTAEGDRSFSGPEVNRLKLEVPFGDVKVKTGGSEFQIHVKRWLEPKGDSAEGRRWVKESKLETTMKDGVLVITELPFGTRNSRRNSEGHFNPHYELTISLPSDKAADLSVGAGDIEINGEYRDLDTLVGAGDIECKSLSVNRSLKIHVGAGDVEASVQGPVANSDVSVGTGDIHLRLPVSANADVDASVGVGEISGIPSKKNHEGMGQHRSAKFGNGGAHVTVHVGVGSIDLSGPTAVASQDRKEDSDNSHSWDMGGALDELDHALSGLDASSWKDGDDKMPDVSKIDIHISDAEIQKSVDLALRESSKAASQVIREAHTEIGKALKEAEAELGKHRHATRNKSLHLEIDKIVREALEQARQELKRERSSMTD